MHDAADLHLSALLEAWSPAEGGAEAIVDVLTGAHGPSGRLPVSVARNAGQVPVYYNHPAGSAWDQGDSVGFTDYVDEPSKTTASALGSLDFAWKASRALNITQQAKSARADLFKASEL